MGFDANYRDSDATVLSIYDPFSEVLISRQHDRAVYRPLLGEDHELTHDEGINTLLLPRSIESAQT